MTRAGTLSKASREAVVTAIREAGPGLRILVLTLKDKGFSYRAGQYVWLGFGGFSPRAYSIASAPDESGRLEIHIKDNGAGGASTYALRKLVQGESVTVAGPEGRSCYDPALHEDRPLLLIGGGMGMAPLKAIVEKALEKEGRTHPVFLYWGVRRPEDFYEAGYFEELAARFPAFHFHPVTGTAVGAAAAADFPDLSGYTLFLGGPQAMIEATLPLLREKGAAAAHIHYDSL